MSKSRGRILTLIVLGVGLGLLAGCDSKQPSASAAGPGGGRPPAPVVVADVVQRDVPIEIAAIGNIEPYQTVQIKSQVNGQIEAVHFTEGQDVRAGQLLFTLDKRPFQAALAQAQAQLRRDQAQAENFQQQANRYSSLEQQGVISRELADQQRTQARATSSAVEADQAAVDAARVELQYTDIRSPIDGRAGAIMINRGNLVKANDTPFLVQVNQVTPIYATFSVPEKHLEKVREYAARRLMVMAYPKGRRENGTEGRLTFIDNAIDPQTGTVKLKATFANKDRRLWPGEFVDVVLSLSTVKGAVLVPSKAIQEGQQGQYCYVVTPQNTAESRVVTTVGTYQDMTLVSKGVQPGERVIVEGQMRVAPNGKVVVQSAAPASTSSNASLAEAAGAAGGSR